MLDMKAQDNYEHNWMLAAVIRVAWRLAIAYRWCVYRPNHMALGQVALSRGDLSRIPVVHTLRAGQNEHEQRVSSRQPQRPSPEGNLKDPGCSWTRDNSRVQRFTFKVFSFM